MKISYQLIKRIHLYACLSTVAVLTMFIFTSYLMIYHNRWDEGKKEISTYDLASAPASESDWQQMIREHQVRGRMTREWTDQEGNPVREYRSAGHSWRLTVRSAEQKLEIDRFSESTAHALIGIHRQRGYGGALQYSLYAFLLDLLAVSLILFTITGIIMWFKLLKNHWLAWAIFIGGFIYFGINMALLMYW